MINKIFEKMQNISIRMKTLGKSSKHKLEDDLTLSCLILPIFSKENIILDR